MNLLNVLLSLRREVTHFPTMGERNSEHAEAKRACTVLNDGVASSSHLVPKSFLGYKIHLP